MQGFCRTISAHHVLNVVRVGIKEGVRLRPHPHPFLVFRSEPVHRRIHLPFLLQHRFKILLHVRDIVRVEEIVAALVQQVHRLVAEHSDNPLVHERKLPAHGMPRDELVRVVRVQVVGRGGGGNLKPRYRHQAAVGVVQVVVLAPIDRDTWKHISRGPVFNVAGTMHDRVVMTIGRGT